MGGLKNKWWSNIYYYCTTFSLSHFFRNSQPPEKLSVSFRNFFRKSECISCYLPISSNLQFQFQKIIFRNSVSVFIQDFNLKFYNTFCEEQSHWLCLLLVVSQPKVHNIYILADIDCTVLIRRIYIISSHTVISILQNQCEICSKLTIKRLFWCLSS